MPRVFILSLFILFGVTSSSFAQPLLGEKAPSFVGRLTDGSIISLDDLRGKYVVLEWTNHECPYVKKHYNSGNMQKTQAALAADGVHWISVLSSAPGKQGFLEMDEAQAVAAERGSYATSIMLDPSGETGKAYRAKTTPQMVIISPEGIILYMGAIDDKPSSRMASIKGARNHVMEAWLEIKAGKDVSIKETKPYGCTVKYAELTGYK